VRIDYTDILERAGTPIWWDDHGAPRYRRFHPEACDIYADEVEYRVMACQQCGWRYRVAFGLRYILALSLFSDVDPPRHKHEGEECAGTTASGELIRVISKWKRHGKGRGWVKVKEAA